ncbi:hypothetical protein L3Q82_019608, partial [Scortum barcoo]
MDSRILCSFFTAAAPTLNRKAGSTEGGESPGRTCHPWRTSTPSGVGRRPPRLLRTPVSPATNCSACCRLADGSLAF